MTTRKIASWIAQLSQQGSCCAHRFDGWTHGWSRLLASAARRALDPASVASAAAFAYFAFFSLFPLTLLIIAIAGFSLGPLIDEALIVRRIEFVAPSLGSLLGNDIDTIIQARGPVTLVALAGLVWSASTFFYMLTGTLNRVWGIKKGRPIWKRRGLAILLVLALVGPILVVVLSADSMMAHLVPWLPDQIIPIMHGARVVLAILLDIALFMVLYLILPHATTNWHTLLVGAVGAGLLWELAKKVFLSLVSSYISASNLIYGSVASIVAILTWAYASGLIFLFGAYLSVSYSKRTQAEAGGEEILSNVVDGPG